MKDTLILILAVVSMLCSGFTSCIYAYLAWKKSKEPPKDEAWEAAIRLAIAGKENFDAQDFAELYEKLSIFTGPMQKENAKKLEDLALRLSELACMEKNEKSAK